MTKESRLKEVFLRYQEEGKWEYPDAFDLWTLGLTWYEIARIVQKRHSLPDDEKTIKDVLEKEAQELGLATPGGKTDDSDQEVGAVISRLFDQYFGSYFRKMASDRKNKFSDPARKLLALLETEGTLRKEGRVRRTEHQMDDIKLAYKHINKQELTPEIIDELVNAGIINQHASYGKKYASYEWVASRYALPLLK